VEFAGSGSLSVDKAAANRFIKHAITQYRTNLPTSQENEHIRFNEHVPIKVTSKMLERAEYEKKIKQEDEQDESEEEEPLKVVEDDSDEEPEEEPAQASKDEGKFEARDMALGTTDDAPEEQPSRSGKKRRQPMDPFAGKWRDNVHTMFNIPDCRLRLRRQYLNEVSNYFQC
jgi:exosome complex protein LRP1